MGFLGDLAKLTRVGFESYERMDVGARLRDAQAQLDALNAPYAAADPQAEARRIATTATIVNCAPTGMAVNLDPVVALELTVMLGGVPVPARTQAPVPQLHLARIVPGAQLAVTVDPTRPESVRIDWR